MIFAYPLYSNAIYCTESNYSSIHISWLCLSPVTYSAISVSLKRLNSKEQHIESNHFVLFLYIYGFFKIGIVHLLSIASFFIYTNKYLFLPTIFIPANVFFCPSGCCLSVNNFVSINFSFCVSFHFLFTFILLFSAHVGSPRVLCFVPACQLNYILQWWEKRFWTLLKVNLIPSSLNIFFSYSFIYFKCVAAPKALKQI